MPTQDKDTLLNHANAHHANHPFLPSCSEPIMERQVSIIGNIFGLSDYGTNSQYDRDANVNLTAIEQLVYFEPDNIFRDMNVNNGILEEENEEHEKDFEKVNLETNSTILEVPLHDPNIPFFTNIDRVDDVITSNWTPQTQSIDWNPDIELKKGLIFQDRAELKRAVQLYSIKRHQMYEVVETKKKI